jgi:hypothetical protein
MVQIHLGPRTVLPGQRDLSQAERRRWLPVVLKHVSRFALLDHGPIDPFWSAVRGPAFLESGQSSPDEVSRANELQGATSAGPHLLGQSPPEERVRSRTPKPDGGSSLTGLSPSGRISQDESRWLSQTSKRRRRLAPLGGSIPSTSAPRFCCGLSHGRGHGPARGRDWRALTRSTSH